jgi:hypothetical protein
MNGFGRNVTCLVQDARFIVGQIAYSPRETMEQMYQLDIQLRSLAGTDTAISPMAVVTAA